MNTNVRFTENGIYLEGEKEAGKEIPLYSGSVHYWRMAPETWEIILINIKKMGFSIVETYIPWSVHEPERGVFDYGNQDPRKDLNKFLDVCEKVGLYVIVRPGPHINAEMTWFGYPEWLLRMPEIQAKIPFGTSVVYPYVTGAFPIPSYAGSKLYEETRIYFKSFAEILRRHCYPQGGIIAIQADNETCNFFRDQPYIMDYSEGSIQGYHGYLKEKYQEIHILNKVYCSTYENFEEVSPPSGYQEGDENLEYYFDWLEYKEYQILEALRKMVGILEELKLPIPIFHNCAYQNYTPISVQRDEAIPGLSVAGIDAYPDPGDTSMLKERIRYLAGSSRLPFVPEFGSGSWFDREQLLSPQEEKFGYLYAFMNGMKAVNFYMLADRDRWTGCPLRNDGSIRENWYKMFCDLLNILNKAELNTYSRTTKILVLKNYDMGRLRALTFVRNRNTFSSNCFIKGTDIPNNLWKTEKYAGKLEMDNCSGGYDRETWVQEIMFALDKMGFEYDISDCYVTSEKMAQYDVIFAASYNFMEGWIQEKLSNFAKLPGRKLYLGPTVPDIDRRGEACQLLRKEKSVNVISNPDEISLDILPLSGYKATNCELAVYKREKDASDLLFVANSSDKLIEASVEFQGKQRFTDVQNNTCKTAIEHLDITLHPFEIQIWKVKMEES